MNPYLGIILFSLAAAYLLNFVARRLNAAALDPSLPQEFNDVMDAEKYARSQQYTRAGMRFSDVSETVSFVVGIGFILLGGYNWLDIFVRSFEFGPILTGLAYFACLSLLMALLGLPFEIYHTFVIENHFGFNTTTVRTFIMDRVKGLVLTALIGGILLSALLWFFRATGELAWVWCWAFSVLFNLALVYVAPQWILPMFNKFSPLEQGELSDAITHYAEKQGYDISGIFVMDGSKRSTKANAFFTGLGKRKRIALFDTLINNHTTDEIVAVLAHEIGHSRLGHIRKRLVSSMLKTGVIFYLLSLFLNNRELFDAFGMQHMSIHAGLVFFALLYTPVALVLSVVSNAISRKHEFEADAFAAKTTGDHESLAAALKKLSANSLSNLTPHPLTVWLNYGHPPVLARIKRLRGL